LLAAERVGIFKLPIEGGEGSKLLSKGGGGGKLFSKGGGGGKLFIRGGGGKILLDNEGMLERFNASKLGGGAKLLLFG